MAGFVGQVVVLGMSRWTPQDVWSSSSLTLPKPKGWGYRLTYFGVVNIVPWAVELSNSRSECAALMSPDASDKHWGCFVTQVPQVELNGGVAVEDMSHEALGFLSGLDLCGDH
ncbi:unnamed protein product, partial [Choristocarpus tenellus]